MLRPRIVPCLLVHNGGLVKTVQFANPRYVGDPINAVKIFNEKGADELMVVDIDAARTGASPDFVLIERLAAECRMPLCYGGGVRTVEHAQRIVGLGVEKVAISSAAIGHPELVTAMASSIGSQSVVVVLDVRQDKAGSYECWTHNGGQRSGRLATDLAREAEARGAGEIVVNSIERDGRMNGYDLALNAMLRGAVSLPITVLGGAGSLADLEAVIKTCGVIGAAAGSLFVFKGALRAVLINYPTQAQKDALIRTALAC